MAHANGIITAPINIETDIYSVLGIGPTANGYDIGYACSNAHGKINKWSKKKPVRIAGPDTSVRNPTWWKATEGNCGFLFPTSGSLEVIKGKDWEYQPPKAGDWYRATDFDGYFHNAEPFISHNYGSSLNINKGTIGSNYTFSFQVNPEEDEYQLSPSSFKNGDLLRQCYISVFIWNSSFNLKVSAKDFFVNADTSADAISIEIPAINLVTGSFTCMFFLSTYKYTAGGPDGAGTCIPFPSSPNSPNTLSLTVSQSSALGINWLEMSYAQNGVYKSITTIEPDGGIGDYAWVFKSYGNIWAKIELVGRSGTVGIGLADLTLRTMTFHGTEETTAGLMYDDKFNRISTISVNAGQKKTIYMQFNNALILKKGNASVPTQGSIGYDMPIEIFSEIEYRKMTTGGHAFYYGQYSTYNQWSWQIITENIE